MFESIINAGREKFGLGDKAGGLLAALLGLITKNGFSGFLENFNKAGLGDAVSSWISTGANTSLSGEQVNSALGADTVNDLAVQAGVDQPTASTALGHIIPQVVDKLTPDGQVPDESTLLSRIGGYLTGLGGAAGAAAGNLGATATETFDKGRETLGTAAGAIGDKTKSAVNRVGDAIDGDSGSSVMRWLLPLLLLLGLIILGFWFCNRAPTTTVTNVNSNTNRAVNAASNNNNGAVKAVDSSFSIKADNGKYTVTGVVPDEATKKKITDALTAQYGAGNVNFEGLRVDAAAKPFAAGWWDNSPKCCRI